MHQKKEIKCYSYKKNCILFIVSYFTTKIVNVNSNTLLN